MALDTQKFSSEQQWTCNIKPETAIIDSVLKQLYWFNLWFALEIKNGTDEIRTHVKNELLLKQETRWIADIVDLILTDTSLREKTKKYEEYKKWVEERAKTWAFSFEGKINFN